MGVGVTLPPGKFKRGTWSLHDPSTIESLPKIMGSFEGPWRLQVPSKLHVALKTPVRPAMTLPGSASSALIRPLCSDWPMQADHPQCNHSSPNLPGPETRFIPHQGLGKRMRLHVPKEWNILVMATVTRVGMSALATVNHVNYMFVCGKNGPQKYVILQEVGEPHSPGKREKQQNKENEETKKDTKRHGRTSSRSSSMQQVARPNAMGGKDISACIGGWRVGVGVAGVWGWAGWLGGWVAGWLAGWLGGWVAVSLG